MRCAGIPAYGVQWANLGWPSVECAVPVYRLTASKGLIHIDNYAVSSSNQAVGPYICISRTFILPTVSPIQRAFPGIRSFTIHCKICDVLRCNIIIAQQTVAILSTKFILGILSLIELCDNKYESAAFLCARYDC